MPAAVLLAAVTGAPGSALAQEKQHASLKATAETSKITQGHNIDVGDVPGLTSDDKAKIRRLEKENAELRRANEILKSASAFFAAELDRPNRY